MTTDTVTLIKSETVWQVMLGVEVGCKELFYSICRHTFFLSPKELRGTLIIAVLSLFIVDSKISSLHIKY